MTLETFDVFSFFMAGLAVGLIGAHYLNQWELKREYERGVLDVLWELWKLHAIRSLGVKTAGDKAPGGETGSSKAV